jgi:hypothetical protein
MHILSEPIDTEDEDIIGHDHDTDNINDSGGTDSYIIGIGPSPGTVTEDEEDEEALNFAQQHHNRTMSQAPTVALPLLLLSFVIVCIAKKVSQQSLFGIMNTTSEKARREEGEARGRHF